MAFYAEVYGYIAKKDGTGISVDVLENACKSSPVFRPQFSIAYNSIKFFYISFACCVKLDEKEDELWLSPFEMILRNIDFVYAAVNFEHEESAHVMLYSYFKDGCIKKVSSKLVAKSTTESIIS